MADLCADSGIDNSRFNDYIMSEVTAMLVYHRANDRFHTAIDWLDSWHSFSFGEHHDPARQGFRALRVINDDRIAGGGGFGTHGHRDMEILTWVLEGAVHHRDSTGGEGDIRPGEMQGMTAGRGIRHSESNASPTAAVHLLQIWLEPTVLGLPPGYAQTTFPLSERQGRLRLVAARDGREGALKISAAAEVYVTNLTASEEVTHVLAAGHHAWVQVARGTAVVNGVRLSDGDGLAISGESAVTLRGDVASELLLFDLA